MARLKYGANWHKICYFIGDPGFNLSKLQETDGKEFNLVSDYVFDNSKYSHCTIWIKLTVVLNRSTSLGISATLCFLLLIPQARADELLTTSTVARIASQISDSLSLADPAMILIDKKTSEVVFERNADSLRKPASILKILSTAIAMEYLGPERQFQTRAFLGRVPRTVSLRGSFDPWMGNSSEEVLKLGRASLPRLASKIMNAVDRESGFAVRSLVVYYSDIYSADLSALGKYFRSKGVTAKFLPISAQIQEVDDVAEIAVERSPTVGTMAIFALTWSDNFLANRLAQRAGHEAGFPMTMAGVTSAMEALLLKLQIDSNGLVIKDGSGLSKLNRISVRLMGQLLLKVREDQKFAAIYDGLPVSGLTGTLGERYFATSPEGIGLVHAKTGTLNGTVSLAGYVDAGDREYIFVVIADRIKKGRSPTRQARNTIDRLLGKIASPYFVAR